MLKKILPSALFEGGRRGSADLEFILERLKSKIEKEDTHFRVPIAAGATALREESI